MRFFIFSLTIAFLFILLGITGGKVGSLSVRVNLLKSQGAELEKDLEEAIAENSAHISELQDYQSVLYVAQGSNTALSKRLLIQENNIEKLQTIVSVFQYAILVKARAQCLVSNMLYW